MPSTKWYHDFLKWLVLFGYFGKIPPILNHHLSDEVPNQDHIILHLATLFSLPVDVFYFMIPWCPEQLSFRHDLPGQLQRHHSPDSKASKTKKTSERNLFANSYSSCLKHLQSSMVRASHSLRHSINASQTRHPSSPCFRNGWPFLGVYLIKCPTLCWKCLTWPAPTGRSLRTEKSFHFGKWQNITKTMPHSGKHHQNPAWFPKIPATCVFKEIWTKQKGHLKKTNLFAENLRNTPCL